MDFSPSHQEYQGSEEITSDKKDRKSKSLDRTMSSSKAYYTSPIKKLQKPWKKAWSSKSPFLTEITLLKPKF